MFRIMDLAGKVSKENEHYLKDPLLSDDRVLMAILKKMIKLNTMDTFLNTAQRQGRISF